MIVEVIIDLKNKSVDKPYSYLVPDELLDVVEVGERCFVEFSNFKRMGFIVKLIDEEPDESIKLKEIDELIDLEPVLSKELIELAKDLAETSYYPFISYLLTMVPATLKVNYSKKLKLLNKDDFRLNILFNMEDEIDYSKIDKRDLPYIKECIKNKDIELVYDFKRKESIKYVRIVKLESIPEKLTDKRKEIV